MRHLRHYLFSLLCCALLLGVFSVNASAKEISVPAYHIYGTYKFIRTPGTSDNLGSVTWYPLNDEVENYTSEQIKRIFYHTTLFETSYVFATDDNTAFTKGGNNLKIYIENLEIVKASFQNIDTNNYGTFSTVVTDVAMGIYYTDGTWNAVTCNWTDKGNNVINIDGSINPSKDVQKIEVTVTSQLKKSVYQDYMNSNGLSKLLIYGAEWRENSYQLKIDQSSEEAGLLSGIIGKLTDVWNTLKNGFTDLVNGITELPAKIWEFIENGLKFLFVPSEDYLVSYKDKWTSLLSDRLGAVWQVTEITFGAWNDIDVSDQTDTISLPSVSIDLPQDEQFSFGGIDVQIVPTGFSFLADAIKLITSILATFLFINGIRKRYDEVMGVEQ